MLGYPKTFFFYYRANIENISEESDTKKNRPKLRQEMKRFVQSLSEALTQHNNYLHKKHFSAERLRKIAMRPSGNLCHSAESRRSGEEKKICSCGKVKSNQPSRI